MLEKNRASAVSTFLPCACLAVLLTAAGPAMAQSCAPEEGLDPAGGLWSFPTVLSKLDAYDPAGGEIDKVLALTKDAEGRRQEARFRLKLWAALLHDRVSAEFQAIWWRGQTAKQMTVEQEKRDGVDAYLTSIGPVALCL